MPWKETTVLDDRVKFIGNDRSAPRQPRALLSGSPSAPPRAEKQTLRFAQGDMMLLRVTSRSRFLNCYSAVLTVPLLLPYTAAVCQMPEG